MTYTIENLFPTALYLTHLPRGLTLKEIEFVNKTSLDLRKNSHNSQSNNVDVLDDPDMKDLKNIILQHIKIYKEDIMSIRDNVEFYITQSWLNYTKKSEAHHEHYHPNSILSGVLYILTEDGDNITFLKDRQKNTILFSHPKVLNPYNSESTNLRVSNGLIAIFPSNVSHQVNVKETSGMRISLAFNTFFKGELNHPIGLQYLKI